MKLPSGRTKSRWQRRRMLKATPPADHPRERPGAKDSWRRARRRTSRSTRRIANRAGNHRAVQGRWRTCLSCCSRTPCPGASGSILLSELSISQPFIQMPVSGKDTRIGADEKGAMADVLVRKTLRETRPECPRLARHASTLLRRKLAVARERVQDNHSTAAITRMYATRPPRKLRNLRTRGHGKAGHAQAGNLTAGSRFFADFGQSRTGTIAREPRKSVGAPMRRVAPLILSLSLAAVWPSLAPAAPPRPRPRPPPRPRTRPRWKAICTSTRCWSWI